MSSQARGRDEDIWRGIDFSGVTVVLGLGTGQLVQLLAEQTRRADGTLLVIAQSEQELQALARSDIYGSIATMQARPRQIPLLAETVDLLAVNGILRQVPTGKLLTMFEEFWRVLVPGGQLRVSDLLEPPDTPYNRAWIERNQLIEFLGEALGSAPAVAVDVKQAARAAQAAGFEKLAVSILPGHLLTDAWLEETVNAVRTMASRVVDRPAREQILDTYLPQLISAYRLGSQRAGERFVMRGTKPGDMALTMEASFTEDDLVEPDKARLPTAAN